MMLESLKNEEKKTLMWVPPLRVVVADAYDEVIHL